MRVDRGGGGFTDLFFTQGLHEDLGAGELDLNLLVFFLQPVSLLLLDSTLLRQYGFQLIKGHSGPS